MTRSKKLQDLDLGELHHFLELEAQSKKNHTYSTNKILEKFNMTDCKQVVSSLEKNLKLKVRLVVEALHYQVRRLGSSLTTANAALPSLIPSYQLAKKEGKELEDGHG